MNEHSNSEQLGNTQIAKKNKIGLIGLIVAIAAIAFIWIPSMFEFLWLAGLILSLIGLFRKPRKMAVIGIITSLVGLVIAIIAVLFDIFSFVIMMG